jgi:hypothetical protein
MQGSKRPHIESDFFGSLSQQRLPSPAEQSDLLLEWMGHEGDSRPGKRINIGYDNPPLFGIVGAVDAHDISWIVGALKTQGLIDGTHTSNAYYAHLTPKGWQRVADLKKAFVSSRFAFFARRFENPELDRVFAQCLRPAVAETGYELRTVTQRAGLVDAIIEDEIRRCRFLIADLSDENAGAYWEAGFAEGLGKPVIYICRAASADKIHFDTNHRHTVKWDPSALDETAMRLKAVIRNTLLIA